jgi:hypothetical protein
VQGYFNLNGYWEFAAENRPGSNKETARYEEQAMT